MAAVAARALVDIEIVSVMQFAMKGLASRWEQQRIYELAIEAMGEMIPRGGLIASIRAIDAQHIPGWQAKVDDWVDSQSEMWGLVYTAVQPYAHLYPSYLKHGLPHMSSALHKLMDPSDDGDKFMRYAPTSTCFVESGFHTHTHLLSTLFPGRKTRHESKMTAEEENFYVYCTMVELNDELSRTHTSGRPLYTTAMKVEIVEKQIQYRRDCLMRKLRPGTLCSDAKINDDRKLDRLKENFKQILIDEALYPSLKQPPPQIRATYEAHVFPNKVRRDLDSERNAVTREMTRHFLETFEGGVFTGWRCSYDYALSRPLNPNALTGQRVTKIFEGKEFLGTVASFKKWWHVVFDDGDEEDLNYRQLSQLKDTASL